MLIIIYN